MRKLILAAVLVAGAAVAQQSWMDDWKWERIPEPVLDEDSWVMVEYWPDVQSVTLTAFFLDGNSEKNKSLCEATKRVFDREALCMAEKMNRTMTSHRTCRSVRNMRRLGLMPSKFP